ncbi:ABC transporter B family member 22 [Vitis vinifera]|uniref:ABC transporter B family member 22 n=1 Tax=Vitis vinifera TaxID=29760 RepID=A0A438HYZ0_VITVI|nr:ABC transporter B family member 22 [Vitis vinifera]
MKGQIQLHEVDFAYPARLDAMIFKGFSINTDAKKSTTLVGHSGSSKSTINGLIKRFYDPLKGIVADRGLHGVLGKKIARLQIGLRGVGEEDRGQGFGKKPTGNN